jgi:hypothetical protein
MYMKEIHADLQTLKPYLYVVAGVFLGIAFCMLFAKLGYLNLNSNKGNNTTGNGVNEIAKLPGQQTEVVDYLKDVDPTKPYTDPNGVTHPALYSGEGTYVPPQPLTPEQLKEAAKNAPPAGGPAPVAPKAPAVPKAQTVPVAPVIPVVKPAGTATSTR